MHQSLNIQNMRQIYNSARNRGGRSNISSSTRNSVFGDYWIGPESVWSACYSQSFDQGQLKTSSSNRRLLLVTRSSISSTNIRFFTLLSFPKQNAIASESLVISHTRANSTKLLFCIVLFLDSLWNIACFGFHSISSWGNVAKKKLKTLIQKNHKFTRTNLFRYIAFSKMHKCKSTYRLHQK